MKSLHFLKGPHYEAATFICFKSVIAKIIFKKASFIERITEHPPWTL